MAPYADEIWSVTPRPRPQAAPTLGIAGAPEPRQAPAAPGVRWLHPVDGAPRVVDGAAVSRRLDVVGVHDPAEWRAAQLTLLLLGVDLDTGSGSAAARWERGVSAGPFDLASRAGISESEIERALERLLQAEVLAGDAGSPAAGKVAFRSQRDGIVLRVAPEYVTDGPAAAVAWSAVTEHLAGSAAALLVARALADLVDRPDRPTVVPYSALARGTRYSEGMVKRGVGAAVAAGVVVQRASRGRAPAYAFSDWALGRVESSARGPRLQAPSQEASKSQIGLASSGQRVAPTPSLLLGTAPASTTLRASVAGVSVEVPAATGGELVVETVVDGRPVTARLTIPAVRT